MKVENMGRSAQSTGAASELAAQSGTVLLLADSFKTALLRARRREEPTREEPRTRSGSRAATTRATTSRSTTPTSETGGNSSRALDTSLDERGVTPDIASLTSRAESRSRYLFASLRTDTPQPGTTTSLNEMFRLRRPTGGNSRSCIEVVHSRTGTRFLLSREGDVWLLAVSSGSVPQPAELRSIVATLNAQFAARGLGAVDVIVNES